MVPLVYIVIINYNNYQDTIECLESLKKINYMDFKILIIDNNSNNNSVSILEESYKEYKIIKLEENLGFARGNNVGIKEAISNSAQFVLLLNNDTIVDPNFLNKMIESFYRNSKSNIGIVGAKIYSFYDKQLSEAAGNIDFFKFITINDANKKSDKCDLEKQTSFISGCCMLINKEVFAKVGLLPDEYFMYYEDTDFCVKVLEAGFKILYNPEAIIFHKISSSSGGKQSPFSIKWNNRNRIIFMDKYKYKVSKRKFTYSQIYIYITRLMRIIHYLIKSDKERANAIYEGLKEGRRYVKNKYNNTLL